MAGVIGGAIVSYALIWKALSLVAPRLTGWPSETHLTPPPLSRTKSMVLLTLALLFAAVFVAHMVTLGSIPILSALSSSDDYGISVIRQEGYFGLPLWLRYMSDYSFKALGPALLVITYLYRKRLFWFVLAIGSLYSLAVFVRILPVIFLTPLLLLLLFQRRWLHLVLTAVLLAVLITIATSASAPSIRSSFVPDVAKPLISQTDKDLASGYFAAKAHEKDWRTGSAIYAIFERSLFVPGQVIDQWFYFYSRPEVREHGCGYRALARVIGCQYVPVPSKLYQAFYQENTQRGMQGSLNAVSFMNDYANFGPIGVVVSTILTALLFCMITVIYRDHPLALPLNIPLVMVSMETSIITALNSGAGWLAMTALFLYFFRTK
ncbi:hypothetical protein AFM18_07170 [Achromobacter spanius]|uniref:Oligosaccharide repeat unit polymerase n=1 Tax=Achromobacter spanius TaxID=217203 RepID=A0AAW3I6W2_9BURK|nr:hypothetical protein AFM18_07170 [Achromobacter spanius]